MVSADGLKIRVSRSNDAHLASRASIGGFTRTIRQIPAAEDRLTIYRNLVGSFESLGELSQKTLLRDVNTSCAGATDEERGIILGNMAGFLDVIPGHNFPGVAEFAMTEGLSSLYPAFARLGIAANSDIRTECFPSAADSGNLMRLLDNSVAKDLYFPTLQKTDANDRGLIHRLVSRQRFDAFSVLADAAVLDGKTNGRYLGWRVLQDNMAGEQFTVEALKYFSALAAIVAEAHTPTGAVPNGVSMYKDLTDALKNPGATFTPLAAKLSDPKECGDPKMWMRIADRVYSAAKATKTNATGPIPGQSLATSILSRGLYGLEERTIAAYLDTAEEVFDKGQGAALFDKVFVPLRDQFLEPVWPHLFTGAYSRSTAEALADLAIRHAIMFIMIKSLKDSSESQNSTEASPRLAGFQLESVWKDIHSWDGDYTRLEQRPSAINPVEGVPMFGMYFDGLRNLTSSPVNDQGSSFTELATGVANLTRALIYENGAFTRAYQQLMR